MAALHASEPQCIETGSCYLDVRKSTTCPGGEIGRRKGLKILFAARRVRVQVPPRAPTATCRSTPLPGSLALHPNGLPISQ